MNKCDSLAGITQFYADLAKNLVEFNREKLKSFFETAVERVSPRVSNECSFQQHFGGIFDVYNLKYQSLCESGAGNGICDHVIKFRDKSCTILIEYKFTKDRRKVDQLAQDALDQIFGKKYYEIVDRGSRAHLIGCAIWKDGRSGQGVVVKFDEFTENTRAERIDFYKEKEKGKEDARQATARSSKKQR